MDKHLGNRNNAQKKRRDASAKDPINTCRRWNAATTACRITPPEETSQRPDTPGVLQLQDGNCLALDDEDACACPQMISFSVCCKWFRWAVLPLDRTLEAEIYRDRDLKRCAEVRRCVVPKSNRGKCCPDCAHQVHRRQKTESERKGGLLWTVKSGKSLDLQGSASPQPGRLVSFIIRPGKRASNRPQNTL